MTRFAMPSAHALEAPPIGYEVGDLDPDLVLAEPPRRSATWLTSCYGRLLLASAGLVVRSEVDTPRLVAQATRSHASLVAALAEIDLGVGGPRPRVLVVGEAPGEFGSRRPLLARSGGWLLRALRTLGYDELGDVYMTNAYEPGGSARIAPERLEALHRALDEPIVLALGAAAAKVLTLPRVVAVRHPAHARRWQYAAAPEGYAEHLLEAGLPRLGPPLEATVPVDRHRPLPPPFDALPLSFTRPRSKREREAGGIARLKAEKARLEYVTGQARTLREAAERAEAGYPGTCRVARAEGWDAQREEFLARVREQALTRETHAQAGRLAGTVRATADVLGALVGKLRARLDDAVATPRDVAELTRALEAQVRLAGQLGLQLGIAEDPAVRYAELRAQLLAEHGADELRALDADVDGGVT